jgi:hypothetical protein
VLEALGARRSSLESQLSDLASKRFGPAFVAELRQARPSNSIIATVVLKTVYATTRVGAVTIDKLRSFEAAIGAVIDQALAEHVDGAAVSVALDEESVSESAAGADTAPWERMGPAFAAIATGIGVLGFVTFVGGAIQFARFWGAGLPAEDAVTILPSQSLVVVGAQTLVPALVLGFIAAAFTLGWRAVKPDKGIEHPELARATIVFTYVGSLELLAFALTLEADGWIEPVVFVPFGLFTAGLCALVGWATDRALYLAASALVALSVFFAGLGFARALDNKDVRAAAIVRDNKQAIVGFWIAENGDRVYLGRLKLDHTSGDLQRRRSRIMAFSKSQVTDIAIGDPKPPEEALRQAQALSDELCDLEIEPVDAKPGDKKLGNCFSGRRGK